MGGLAFSLPCQMKKGVKAIFYVIFMALSCLLIALVTHGEPAPGNKKRMHDVVPPKGAFW